MNFLIKSNKMQPFFERSVESIIHDGFFNSFDTNIQDFSDKYVLQVAVPGMNKEHLNVEMNGNVLNIYGKRESSNENTVNHYTEFSSSQFSRSFILPEDANHDVISAQCSNGLLRIEIEKKLIGQSVTRIKIEDSERKENFLSKILKPFRKKK